MFTEDNVMVAVYCEDERMHLIVNSANAIHYSIKLDISKLDAELTRMCMIAPVVSKVDVGEAEMYDGNLDADPSNDDVARCVEFARWAKRHDLQCHGDMFEYFE